MRRQCLSELPAKSGQPSITVLDECWSLLDSPVLADCVVQLFRTARKRGASVWGISQTLEDFVGTKQKPKEHGAGILRNTSVKIIGQQPGDVSPLVDHLGLNTVAVNEVKRFAAPRKGRSAEVLLVLGKNQRPPRRSASFLRRSIIGSRPHIRGSEPTAPSFLRRERTGQQTLIDLYRNLAERFPQGLAEVEVLPEEASGAVQACVAKREKPAMAIGV